MLTKISDYLEIAVYWLIILLPFAVAIAPAPANVFWGMLIGFYLISRILRRQKIIPYTPINAPFIVFILVSAVSMINSINCPSSLRGLFKLVQYGLLFVAMEEFIKDKKHFQRIIFFMIAGSMLASVDGFWQLVTGKDFIRGNSIIVNIGLNRATAAFPNANVFGIYLVPLSVILSGLALYYYKGVKKIVMLIFSGVVLASVFLTFSRFAVIGCFTGLFLMALIRKDKLVISAFVIFILLFPFIMPKGAKEWAKSVNYNPVVFLCNTDRISIYKNAANMIKHHPIIGVGVNTFSINYQRYKLPEPDDCRTGDSMYAHNNFLQIAGETGLLGLIAFFWVLIAIFKAAISCYKRAKDEFLKVVSLSITCSLAAFLINGLTETSLYYKRVSVIFWFIVGLVLALRSLISADRAPEN